MTTQAAFTAEEWTLLRILPSLVSSGASAAEPSGIFGSIHEAAAGMARRPTRFVHDQTTAGKAGPMQQAGTPPS